MSPKKTNVETRLNELEATVRGLTQELVEANERIRHLEAGLDAEEAGGASDGAGALAPEQRNGAGEGDDGDDDGAGGSTKQMSDDGQADDDAGSDLDDIIVA